MTIQEHPLAGIEHTEKGARALDRIKERFNIESLPQAFEVLAGSENGVHDLYMNLNRQLAEGKVEEKVKLLVAVGVASAVGSAPGVELFTHATIASGRSKQEALEAVSVASVCGVFNWYYRFRHQIPDDWKESYEKFKAPFNANSFMKSGLTQQEVEAICVAVSSVNNCHACVEGHTNKAKSLGFTDDQIDELIRAAAVTAATANALGALITTSAPQTAGA